jgi:hypothetical protein
MFLAPVCNDSLTGLGDIVPSVDEGNIVMGKAL